MSEAADVSVGQVIEALGLRTHVDGPTEAAVTGAQAGDLLSYIMAHGKQGHFWITVQTHPNIVAVAALAGMSGIVIAGGFEPEPETVERAEDEGVALLGSDESTFTLAGKLYALGVR